MNSSDIDSFVYLLIDRLKVKVGGLNHIFFVSELGFGSECGVGVGLGRGGLCGGVDKIINGSTVKNWVEVCFHLLLYIDVIYIIECEIKNILIAAALH